uniref:DUF4283 domain-containing protein n=1 Tax=Setaria italica TaxID=4555 RepID=K4A0X3_SETIT
MVGGTSPRQRASSAATTLASSRSLPSTPSSRVATRSVPTLGAAFQHQGAGSETGSASAATQEEYVSVYDTSKEVVSVESEELLSGPDYLKIWVAEGDWEHAVRFSFVEVEPPGAAVNPAPLIHSAFHVAVPQLRFQLLPSSRGVALVHFGTAAAREAAMAVQPIRLNRTVVHLERVEDTDDRFLRESAWLAHVATWNLPEEHREAEKVRDIYSCVGSMIEIDPFCLPEFDWSCMCFIIELQHPHVPSRLGVHTPSGHGVVLRQSILVVWPCEQQLDANGDWIPFFAPLPPTNSPSSCLVSRL